MWSPSNFSSLKSGELDGSPTTPLTSLSQVTSHAYSKFSQVTSHVTSK